MYFFRTNFDKVLNFVKVVGTEGAKEDFWRWFMIVFSWGGFLPRIHECIFLGPTLKSTLTKF
ncbi:hypothetical protein MB09_07650 [Aequorivita vladivostokensis]|uniref:Transmembrane protein n=1 Tax=Aequorivita vladivostokensis TaxID=171194 RepID=A0ABR5DIG0_9FLAO|nr:hypothetical protein MB09_07650 [Aequorivita vladivostokensis]